MDGGSGKRSRRFASSAPVAVTARDEVELGFRIQRFQEQDTVELSAASRLPRFQNDVVGLNCSSLWPKGMYRQLLDPLPHGRSYIVDRGPRDSIVRR